MRFLQESAHRLGLGKQVVKSWARRRRLLGGRRSLRRTVSHGFDPLGLGLRVGYPWSPGLSAGRPGATSPVNLAGCVLRSFRRGVRAWPSDTVEGDSNPWDAVRPIPHKAQGVFQVLWRRASPAGSVHPRQGREYENTVAPPDATCGSNEGGCGELATQQVRLGRVYGLSVTRHARAIHANGTVSSPPRRSVAPPRLARARAGNAMARSLTVSFPTRAWNARRLAEISAQTRRKSVAW